MVNTMKKKNRLLKYIGIAIMILSYPLGSNLFYCLISSELYPVARLGYTPEALAITMGFGVLEIFSIGLVLLIYSIKDNNK